MSARRLRSIAAVWLCALGGMLALTTASASAHLTHPYLCQITGSPIPSPSECNLVGNTIPGGALQSPQGVAVDSTGQVYVSDGVPARVVDIFDSSGNFTRQLTGASPSEPFYEPFGLAIDGSNDLWVADPGPGLMDKFSLNGTLLAQGTGEGHWEGEGTKSVAFSVASNGVYVADSYHGDLWVLNADGTYREHINGPWTGSNIFAAADNSTGPAGGDVYVASSAGNVYRVDGAGAPAPFSGSAPYISGAQLTGTPEGPFGAPSGVTVDPAGDVYVLDGGKGVVDEFNAAGVFVSETSGLGTPNGSLGPYGLAANSSGDLYVASRRSPAAVDVFGPLADLPSVSVESAATVEASGAKLRGDVNPENAGAVTCQFEWGTTTAYGHVAPCSAPVPNGEGAVPVQAQLSGLEANTSYHYRLLGTNSHGTEISADETFRTPGPPVIEGESAEVAAGAKRGQSSATLQAQIVPEGRETTYRFEYGETSSYGTSVPSSPASIGSGEAPVSVPAAEQWPAEAELVYHYRVVASNE